MLRSALSAGLVALLTLTMAGPALASRADLARALSLYNDRQFDQAIEAASAARKSPETQDAGAVVLARAHLERYRRTGRSRGSQRRPGKPSARSGRPSLEPRVRLEYLLAPRPGAVPRRRIRRGGHPLRQRRVFRRGSSTPRCGESFVDWWGSAVERQADVAAGALRVSLFNDLAEDMRTELGRSPESAAAVYWTAAALRGAGYSSAAWDAATSGWVRARLAGERAAMLRADLDKLVLQGVIPDRVRLLPPLERAAAESQLRADWELIKERWR